LFYLIEMIFATFYSLNIKLSTKYIMQQTCDTHYLNIPADEEAGPSVVVPPS